MKRRSLLTAVLFCGAGLTTLSLTPVGAREPEGAAVERLREDLKYLSSDELEGRGVGLPGLRKAAEFVRDEFKKAGLRVDAVNGDAFQTFDLVTDVKLGEPNGLTLTGPDKAEKTLKLGEDFQVGAYGTSGKFSGDLVFAGYGIDAEEAKYNDFEGADVAGKVVIVLRRTPRQDAKENPFSDGHGQSRHADLRAKLRNAMSRKAAAVLFVNDAGTIAEAKSGRRDALEKARNKVIEQAESAVTVWADGDAGKAEDARKQLTGAVEALRRIQAHDANVPTDGLMAFGYAANKDGGPLPAFHITRELATKLLESGLGKSLADLEKGIDEDLKPRSAALVGWKVAGQATVDLVKSPVSNVVGVLEGEGPHADETIVIGAHYDHVGRGGNGSLAPGSTDIHNGADDNASGTTALIEVARRLAGRGEKPRHRIVFIAFTGEELGLLGSARYVREPVFPLEKTVAMINMDMVGRLSENKLTVFGAATAKSFEGDLKALNEALKFDLILKPEGFGPSDHSSFYARKIPVLHFFTGLHNDYHRPSDDWDKVNYEGIARVCDYIERMTLKIDLAASAPEYIEVKGSANVGRTGSRPYVGTIPDFGVEQPGYAISGVAPGSPAEKAGLKGGDRVVKLGTHAVTNLDDFDAALRRFKAGEAVEFQVVRQGQTIPLVVTLESPR